MWDVFALTVLAVVAILYLPGFLLVRSLSWRSTATSLVIAPLVSIALYEVLAIVYEKVGLFTSALTLFVPLFCASVCIFVISCLRKKSTKPNTKRFSFASEVIFQTEAPIMVLYVLVAALVALFYFIIPLDGPASFSQESDNTAHLGYIQSFLASGNYSVLDVSLYHDIQGNNASPTGRSSGSFYPAAWHCVAALAASLVGSTAPIAANAALLTFIVVVFPLGVYLFVRYISNDNKTILCCGSVISLAFAAFPWGMITFGPLYPNMAAYSCVLPTACLFIYFCDSIRAKNNAIDFTSLALFFVGLLTLAVLQPNAVFTVGVLLIAFCFKAIYKATGKINPLIRGLCLAAFLIVVGVLWIFLYELPFLQSVVSFAWEPFTSIRQAVVNVAVLSYGGSTAQLFLAALVLAGILYCFAKRKNRWLVVTYLITCFLVLIASFADGSLRSFFTGFWYTDSYRIAAMAALAGIPLAALGLYSVFKALGKAWIICTRLCCVSGERSISGIGVVVLFILSICLIYYPTFSVLGIGTIGTPFGDFEARWHDENHSVNICIMDGEEEHFLEKVSQTVLKEDLILNIPDDGSVFAYGAYDLNVYYRRTGVAAIGKEAIDSELIRLNLVNYSNDFEVQKAVEESGAKYLLVLDQGDDINKNRYWFGHYNSEEWVGIDAVNDSTPGFKVVLSEGDMRLYEIEPIE